MSFVGVALLALTALGLNVIAQTPAPVGEWPTYGADLGNTRYSPLAQITPTNFKDLELAWRFRTESLGPRPEYQFEATPLMVHNVLYTTAGTRRAVVALDAVTGELLWMHSEVEGGQRRPGSETTVWSWFGLLE
jgi:quinoprotein glucose dehydrogenase